LPAENFLTTSVRPIDSADKMLPLAAECLRK
jgi:hypothetical protein